MSYLDSRAAAQRERSGGSGRFPSGVKIAGLPARKLLPSGGNAHCTIRPVKWWDEQLTRAARAKPVVKYEFHLAYLQATQMKERVLSSVGA